MHLESAVGRLDEELSELDRQINILRQEEITEEIEVLLLNTTSLDEKQSQTSQETMQTKGSGRG
jgi:F-type H+-transporting ATPase subunit gamma